MTTNSKIWVSELNERPEVRGSFSTTPIRFYDTTLRDGEQTVGVVLSPQQKLEIARKLDELGVSRIEAGFPRVSVEDAEAIQLMQKAGIRAELWGFSRAVKADIDELVRLNLRYTVIEAPTSEIKLKAYGISREEVLRKIRDAISTAHQAGITVAFFAVDGTRTELEFLKTVYMSAIDAGAKELVVVDTIGACGPEAAEYLTRQVCQWAGKDVPVHFHGHNDFGMATACAVAAVRGGATWVQGTINGMGERAGECRYRRDCARAALSLRRAGRAESRKGARGFRVGAALCRLHARGLEAAGRPKLIHARKRCSSHSVSSSGGNRALRGGTCARRAWNRSR